MRETHAGSQWAPGGWIHTTSWGEICTAKTRHKSNKLPETFSERSPSDDAGERLLAAVVEADPQTAAQVAVERARPLRMLDSARAFILIWEAPSTENYSDTAHWWGLEKVSQWLIATVSAQGSHF